MSSNDLNTRTRILGAAWRTLLKHSGQGVRMSDIATTAGVSRQAVYDHFGSRADLMIATVRYGDYLLGLDDRLRAYRAVTSGVERMDAFVLFWGNYMPEIYGVAKALLAAREADAAVAAAWDDRMASVRDGCREVIAALDKDGLLVRGLSTDEATDLLWNLLSIAGWEQLTVERGWSQAWYIKRTQEIARRAFVRL